jgi:pyridoxamine 5'-phosphate oxidase
MLSISNLREHYGKGELNESDLTNHPMELFDAWFRLAVDAGIKEPNAMILGTVSIERKPRARVVLLKDYSKTGFSFFTNYQSDKGREIELNNNVCLTFNWLDLEKQIRIEGKASKLPPDESDAYFNSRPEGSKLSALASNQSQPIGSREELERKLMELERTEEILRPKYWGGYLIKPNLIEFWQGRADRMHDRIVYSLKDNQWSFKRLQP